MTFFPNDFFNSIYRKHGKKLFKKPLWLDASKNSYNLQGLYWIVIKVTFDDDAILY